MSGFQDLALIVSRKGTTVTSDESDSLSIVARNDHLQTYNGSIEQQVAYTSEVASISGNLQSQIDELCVQSVGISGSDTTLNGYLQITINGVSYKLATIQ